jgi:hypothetical protein
MRRMEMFVLGLELLVLVFAARLVMLLLGVVIRLIEIIVVIVLILLLVSHQHASQHTYRYGGTANFHIANAYTP